MIKEALSLNASVSTVLDDETTATFTIVLSRSGGVMFMPLVVHLTLTEAPPMPVRFNAYQSTRTLRFVVPRTDAVYTLGARADDTALTLATVTLPGDLESTKQALPTPVMFRNVRRMHGGNQRTV